VLNLQFGLKADATLVERPEFDDRGAVVIAHPESDGVVELSTNTLRIFWTAGEIVVI